MKRFLVYHKAKKQCNIVEPLPSLRPKCLELLDILWFFELFLMSRCNAHRILQLFITAPNKPISDSRLGKRLSGWQVLLVWLPMKASLRLWGLVITKSTLNNHPEKNVLTWSKPWSELTFQFEFESNWKNNWKVGEKSNVEKCFKFLMKGRTRVRLWNFDTKIS